MSIAIPLAAIDRDRLLNDLTNTGVIAALLGGFALSCLSIDLSSCVLSCLLIGLSDFLHQYASDFLHQYAIFIAEIYHCASATDV